MTPARLPGTEHTARPWRIHRTAPDVEVADVWAFGTPGTGPDGSPVVLAALRAAGGLRQNPPVVRLPSAVRWALGALVDRDEHAGSGARTAAGPPGRPGAAVVPPGSHDRTEPHRAAPGPRRGTRTTTWAGRLIVFYGAAHTLGALTVEGAARHAGAWFSGELWGEDLADMSPANSAYWLSVDSFGMPLVLVGLTVLWMHRRGLTPPPFIAWTLGAWTVVDAVVLGPTPVNGWILPLASGLLLAGARRATRHADRTAVPSPRP